MRDRHLKFHEDRDNLVGKATGDRDTENEGKADQAKSSLKDAGEKVKDAFKK